MTQVAGWTAAEAASGLFLINLAMLITFWAWGMITPGLARRGIPVERLIAWGLPLSFGVIGVLVWMGPSVGAGAAVGMAFPAHLAGRALSAYNLVIFAGIFVVQWGIGLAVDVGRSMGLDKPAAYQAALGAFALCSFGSWLYFVLSKSDQPR